MPTLREANFSGNVIFLGAGRGSRLMPYTSARPKWLLNLRGRPLLHYLTAIAHQQGATGVVVVRGQAGGDPGLPCVGVIENPYDRNMVDSLFRAEEYFGDDFVMSYADIIYEPRVFQALASSDSEVAVVVDRDWFDYYRFRSSAPLDIAETLAMSGGRITDIGRPIPAGAQVPDGQYFGLVRFRGAGVSALRSTYHEVARSHWGKRWRHAAQFELAFMTDLLQELIDRGVEVRATVIERGWLEFDTKEDYERVLDADENGEVAQYIDLSTLPERPTVVSAGGVLWRLGAEGLEALLVEQQRLGEWRLPKGMQKPGEDIRRTAEREVREETGHACRVGASVGRSTWTYLYEDRLWDEFAYFYLLESAGDQGMVVDSQILSTQWANIHTALEMLKYDGERDVLRTASELLTGRR